MSRRTNHEILGVSENAPNEEIIKAYRALALREHPDKKGNTPESNEKFKEIQSAYEALTKRQEQNAVDVQQDNGGLFSDESFRKLLFGADGNAADVKELLEEYYVSYKSSSWVKAEFKLGVGSEVPEDVLQLLFILGKINGRRFLTIPLKHSVAAFSLESDSLWGDICRHMVACAQKFLKSPRTEEDLKVLFDQLDFIVKMFLEDQAQIFDRINRLFIIPMKNKIEALGRQKDLESKTKTEQMNTVLTEVKNSVSAQTKVWFNLLNIEEPIISSQKKDLEEAKQDRQNQFEDFVRENGRAMLLGVVGKISKFKDEDAIAKKRNRIKADLKHILCVFLKYITFTIAPHASLWVKNGVDNLSHSQRVLSKSRNELEKASDELEQPPSGVAPAA